MHASSGFHLNLAPFGAAVFSARLYPRSEERGLTLGVIKLSIAGVITAVKTMQLVQARDGNNDRKINDVFHEEDFEILENLNRKLEGKTEKQKNHHKEKSLAWGCWIISRLGGWMGYNCERPPGPITIKRGLDYFQKIKVGWMLSKDVCIP